MERILFAILAPIFLFYDQNIHKTLNLYENYHQKSTHSHANAYCKHRFLWTGTNL